MISESEKVLAELLKLVPVNTKQIESIGVIDERVFVELDTLLAA